MIVRKPGHNRKFNRKLVLFVQRHWSGGIGIDPEVWPSEEEVLQFKEERESMLTLIEQAQAADECGQKKAYLEVDGDFESGCWRSGSRNGLLEFFDSDRWTGGGGTTDYARELA